MIHALAFLVLLALPQDDDPALRILEDLHDKAPDRALLERSLAEVDALTKKAPANANNHYARGWLLTRVGKPDDAVAAYDEALRLKPSMANAAYNAGVVLSKAGRDAEAIAHYDLAVAADPKHVDAYYNSGQAFYNRKDFKNARDRWSKARALTPDDFNIAKKLLQCDNALGDVEAAAKTRQALFALHETSADPKIRALKGVVIDQFDVGKCHVYAYETFEPSGDLYNVYTFKPVDAADKPQGTVDLESSAVIREAGTPYMLGLMIGGTHINSGLAFKTLPSYAELKPAVVTLIEKHFATLVKGTP